MLLPDKRQMDFILPHTVLETTVPVLIDLSTGEYSENDQNGLPANDGLEFFNDIKVDLIIVIFQTRFSPWNRRREGCRTGF